MYATAAVWIFCVLEMQVLKRVCMDFLDPKLASFQTKLVGSYNMTMCSKGSCTLCSIIIGLNQKYNE